MHSRLNSINKWSSIINYRKEKKKLHRSPIYCSVILAHTKYNHFSCLSHNVLVIGRLWIVHYKFIDLKVFWHIISCTCLSAKFLSITFQRFEDSDIAEVCGWLVLDPAVTSVDRPHIPQTCCFGHMKWHVVYNVLVFDNLNKMSNII